MSDMKCPFCQQELDTGNYYIHCHNPHCDITVEMEGTEEMWEALIRMRKALEIAWDALIYDGTSASKAAIDKIKAITPAKQKDVK